MLVVDPVGVYVPGLRAERLAQALSQVDLARRAHVGRNTILRAEAGHSIRVSNARRLARALRVSPRRLQRGPPVSH